MVNNCYLINFQLTGSPVAMVTAIKSYSTWAKITDNSWAIVTDKKASQIRDHLKNILSSNDRLFVVKSGAEAAWKNVACSNEWLLKNI